MTATLLMLFKGFLVGLGVSIPLGPIGVLCVNRTLQKGVRSGFFSGMGAAAADTIFALIAVMGLSYVIHFIEQRQLVFELTGGLMITLLGLRVYLKSPGRNAGEHNERHSLLRDFFSVLFFTLSNPVAVFLFGGMFAGFNLIGENINPLLLTAGVFTGASLWWLLLSSSVSFFRHHIRSVYLHIINKVTGSVITMLGLLTLVHALYGLIA